MINNVVLVGRLVRDPVLRKTGSGKSVGSFTLAIDRRKFDRNDPENKADFIPCVAWNQTADLLYQYCKKGSQIGCEGRIQTRNYDDPNNPGRKIYVTEVVMERLTFLETKQQENEQQNIQYDEQVYANDENSLISVTGDDLPF